MNCPEVLARHSHETSSGIPDNYLCRIYRLARTIPCSVNQPCAHPFPALLPPTDDARGYHATAIRMRRS